MSNKDLVPSVPQTAAGWQRLSYSREEWADHLTKMIGSQELGWSD